MKTIVTIPPYTVLIAEESQAAELMGLLATIRYGRRARPEEGVEFIELHRVKPEVELVDYEDVKYLPQEEKL